MPGWFETPYKHGSEYGNPPGPTPQETLADYYKNILPKSGIGKAQSPDDWQGWLNQSGYGGLNNFPHPKLGWFGMGGFPNNSGSMIPWWQFWGGGRPPLGGGFYG